MNSTILLDLFTDPLTIGTLSRGDKMIASMYVIILGLGATFLVLSLLSILTSIMSKTLATFTVGKNQVATVVGNQQQTDDEEDEIAAVIAAAVAAYNNRN